MVLFASLRPRFKKVVACTMIISALASAGSKIQELKNYPQIETARAAYSEIIGLNQVRERNERAMIKARDMLIEAAYAKSKAEKLAREGRAEESKNAYRELLRKDEEIVKILTTPDELNNHIALAKNRIIILKRELKNNEFFDPNRKDIKKLEEEIYYAWVEVDRLTKSVSNEVQEVERILGMIN